MEAIILSWVVLDVWLKWINFGLAVFAALVAVGYFLKPRLFFVGFVHDKKWEVRVINKNFVFSIKEIKCEMGVSDEICFNESKTLPLTKDYTLFLKHSRKFKGKLYIRDYVFKTIDRVQDIQSGTSTKGIKYCQNYKPVTEKDVEKNKQVDSICTGDSIIKKYSFLRVRLLATNLLGVRKHYERIYKIDCLNTSNCEKLLGNYAHRRLTNILIKEELLKSNLSSY